MKAQYEYQLTHMSAETFNSAVINLRCLEAPCFAGDDVHINMYVNDETGNCEAIWVGSNRDAFGRVRDERRMILVPVDLTHPFLPLQVGHRYLTTCGETVRVTGFRDPALESCYPVRGVYVDNNDDILDGGVTTFTLDGRWIVGSSNGNFDIIKELK